MKASLRLPEEHRAPILKAKVPFCLLNLPLISSLAAGDPSDLQLGIATAFHCGPTVQASYRPNDAKTPIAVSVRLGAGEMGSPVGSAIVMKAELGSGAPRFSIVFKPCFGDFCIRKAFQSNSRAQAPSRFSENGVRENGFQSNGDTGDNECNYDIFSGPEATAVSALPVRNGSAEVKFRWGVRLPSSVTAPQSMTGWASISPSRLPFLVVSKISIKQITRKDVSDLKGLNEGSPSSRDNSDMMEKVRTENKMLHKEAADLWAEIMARRKTSSEVRQTKNERRIEHRPTTEEQSISPREKDNAAKSRNNEAAEELRKALMGSAIASANSKR
ncbi:hypothetical protein FCM35_KLT08991 [Carex littledalei]|uniref:Uncharacterized protein n=1 Tax=Carex littledalei TaxID=544730 RepID=A0A833QW16_9POAL|nr:hypothetical protein FCM35_KLT08991 [Carex littledalei]